MLKPYLYLDITDHAGRGVFTKEKIPKGTVIEISPVIVMEKEDREHLDKTKLHDYIFEWGKERDKVCMALGFIPMYNHSYKSNCDYFMDYEEDVIMIETVRTVEKGEELTINYNGDSNDATKIWFDAV
ncbi:SET domain-containing protein-lysine N-methyltransferase [Ferruginibacter sp.]